MIMTSKVEEGQCITLQSYTFPESHGPRIASQNPGHPMGAWCFDK